MLFLFFNKILRAYVSQVRCDILVLKLEFRSLRRLDLKISLFGILLILFKFRRFVDFYWWILNGRFLSFVAEYRRWARKATLGSKTIANIYKLRIGGPSFVFHYGIQLFGWRPITRILIQQPRYYNFEVARIAVWYHLRTWVKDKILQFLSSWKIHVIQSRRPVFVDLKRRFKTC